MTLTIELSDDLNGALQARARAKGVSAADFARKALEQILRSPVDEELSPGQLLEMANQPHRPLSARIRGLWSDMPDEVRAEYPEGGAYQIDHHVYGLPKR